MLLQLRATTRRQSLESGFVAESTYCSSCSNASHNGSKNTNKQRCNEALLVVLRLQRWPQARAEKQNTDKAINPYTLSLACPRTEKERDDIGYASHGGYRTHVCRIPIGSGIRRPKVHHVPLQPRSHLAA